MKHIYIIDTKLLAYRMHQTNQAVSEIFNHIGKLLIQLPKGEIYLCGDLGKSSYRVDKWKHYKGQRAKVHKTEEDKEKHRLFNEQYTAVVDIARSLKATVLAVNGLEADDMASMIAYAHQDLEDTTVTLISGDHDWYTMVINTDNVQIIDPFSCAIHDSKYVQDKYNCTTRLEYNWLKVLSGDKSDNIIGLKQFGPVKVKAFWAEVLESTDQSVEAITAKLVTFLEQYPIVCIHQLHEDVGNTTVLDVITTNMSIADPFTDFSKLTEAQIDSYTKQINSGGSGTSRSELFELGIQKLGAPIILNENASRVFGVSDV